MKSSEKTSVMKTAKQQAANPRHGGNAVVGVSIKIQGDISGEENLLINGTVEGIVDFREHNVVVGEKGRVHANVNAKNITVEGEIKGDLRGGEQIVIKPSGRVTGDIHAPRVILDDGCQFKGSVDMEKKAVPATDARNIAAKLAGAKPLGYTPMPPGRIRRKV